MNNRKRTPGRRIIHVPDVKIIGFTLKVRHGSPNYKKHEQYRKFVEVVDKAPEKVLEKVKAINLSQKAIRKQKLDRYVESVEKALLTATEIAQKNKFECIVIPKIINTSTVRNLSL
jgi:hypothetical protein